ncbi:hypothetical protein PQE75_gp039 [Bacillus phage vB_BcoS-136]|uniref:Uncharacterized protein n=1 Tax=Bacillus phage vB_BcoS-136 TaxID=2419619 RepID=A0A3G3BVJ4_9CAUD|nr:hypothetical protein PQE75_gp039 [Bacillus phage vB_BcoS-136]AYP68171.1 hypothetical protein vBBcoS136_00039 [Bacillus phage vB_BcoS-136]
MSMVLFIVVSFLFGCFVAEQYNIKKQESLEVSISEKMEKLRENSNGSKFKKEADFDFYTYKVTELIGNEIHGIALDNISVNNSGIFLYDYEVGFEVQIGDKILVTFGEYEDEILEVKKLN